MSDVITKEDNAMVNSQELTGTYHRTCDTMNDTDWGVDKHEKQEYCY